MRRIALAALALATAVCGAGLLAFATTAPAQAYPDASITVEISDTTVFSGERFTVKAEANVDCDWTATFAGKKHTGSGVSFKTHFVAPHVKHKTVYKLTVSCSYATASGGAAAPSRSSTSRSYDITVLPKKAQGGPNAHGRSGAQPASAHSGGFLPGTGGPFLWLLILGLVLVLAGTIIVRRRRARGF